MEAGTTANTPWGMWTAAEETKKDAVVSHATLIVIMEEIKRDKLGREINLRDQSNLGMKAWIQSDKSSSAWVTTCPS
jgi:hypothetical protein